MGTRRTLPSLRSRQTAKGRHSHATNVESTFRSCAEGRLTTSTPGKKCDDSQQLAPTNSSTLRYRLGMIMAILIARQVFKSFVLSEARGSRFEFRAESFNTWNHTEFDQVSNGLGASNFGQVTTAFDPRVFQFGAKLYY
jgi:hypothetical protein